MYSVDGWNWRLSEDCVEKPMNVQKVAAGRGMFLAAGYNRGLWYSV